MDTFSLYDDLPLFSGDLLVGWSPLADELPAQVQDELQHDDVIHMYPTLAHGDELVKGSILEEPQQVEKTTLQSLYLDTSVNLLDLLKPDGISQPPVSPQVMPMDSPKELQKQTSVEDMLQNVSEMLIANLTPVQLISESNSSSQGIDLSGLHNLSGETGMLNDEEVDSILNGNDNPVDTLLSNSTNALAADILSPVSPEDVDYILSSSPTSPFSTNASSPCSSNMYSSYPTSPYSLDTSLETEPSVDDTFDTPVTVSMKYLREELLKPSPSTIDQNKKEISRRVSGRQKSQRQRVKYEPYSPSHIESFHENPGYSKASSKSSDQRSERKKQQNKDAALRYRQKKREEKGTVKDECNELEKKNIELKDKVDSMTREIQYLKDLLSEVYKAKATSDKKKSI